MSEGRIVFCFGVEGYRDDHHDNYHPATLYRKGADGPYGDFSGEANEMMHEAFDALPKPPEEYDREDAGRGGWFRFDYEALVSGENTDPIQTADAAEA